MSDTTSHLPRRAARSVVLHVFPFQARTIPSHPLTRLGPPITHPSRLGSFHGFLPHLQWFLIQAGFPSLKLGRPHLLLVPQARISPHAPYPKCGQPTFPPLTTLGTPPISSLHRVGGKKGSAGASAAVGDVGKAAGGGAHIWGHPGRDNPAGWQPHSCSLPKPH